MPSPKRPSPAFPLYAGDVLADTGALSTVEFSVLFRLVLNCWRLRTLPADHARLARMAQVSLPEFEAALPALADQVYRDGDCYRTAIVEKAVAEQATFAEKQRQIAMCRWKDHKPKRKGMPRHATASRGMPTHARPCPPASDAASDVALAAGSSLPAPAPAAPPPAPKDPGPRRKFTDGWAALFAEHRGGVGYVFEGAKDGGHVTAILGLAGGDVPEALRRAEVHLTDPFWSERGANLGTFRSQWNRCVHTEGGGNGHAPTPLPRAIQAFKDYAAARDKTIIDVEPMREEH